MRSKSQVVQLLTAMAKWQRRQGDDRRSRAYARAATALERRGDEEFAKLLSRNALRTIPGIGESIERTITRFVEKGETPSWLGGGAAGQPAGGDEGDERLWPEVPQSYHDAPFDKAPDLHCHTTWSDGTLTLEEVVEFAQKLSAPAIGISDHSGSLGIANGLKPDEVRAQWAAIDELQAKHPDIVILKGTECDVLRDGRLDHPEEILHGFDYVIGSLHSQLKLPMAHQTERVLRALENPYLTILGHPTTRVPDHRPRANLDLEKVFEKAALYEVALEVNGNPGRIDLDEELALRALQSNARLSLGSDGHSAWEMLALANARRIAARAGARSEDIVNFDVLARARARARSRALQTRGRQRQPRVV